MDPTYVRRKGAEKRVGQSSERVNPVNHARRPIDKSKPIPFTADYFGQKVHIDQNEKLVYIYRGLASVPEVNINLPTRARRWIFSCIK